jgi:hypothetical protein
MLHTLLPRKLRSRSSSLALLLEFIFDFGEPHYECDYSVESNRAYGSIGPSTVGDMGKAHRIHAAVNNHQEENHLTVLEMSGTVANQNLSI